MRLTPIALAAPLLALSVAAAGHNAPTDAPPVSGGDLGCVIRLVVMAAAADKGAENPQKSEKDRETSRESARKARHDMAWYLARLELTPDNGQRPAEGFKIYGEFMKLPAEAMLKEIDLCQSWSREHQTATLSSIKTKQ